MGVSTKIKQDSTYLNYLTRAINDGGSYEQVPLYQYVDQYNKLLAYNPVLLLYPSSQKNNSLYCITPNNNSFNFTSSRTSTATYFDKNGSLQIAPNNTPRFEWNPSTGEYSGALIESSYTNLFSNNNLNLLTESSYTNKTFLPNEFGSGSNGFLLQHTSGTFLAFSYTIGNTLTSQLSGSSLNYSCIVKNPSSNNFGIWILQLGTVYYRFSTLESRNVGNSANITHHSISRIGNNTYRLVINGILPNGASPLAPAQFRQALIFDYNSANSSTVTGSYILGLPTAINSSNVTASTAVNALPNIISLIPTVGSSVTKGADTITSPLLNYNTTSWSMFFEVEYLSDFVGSTGDVNGSLGTPSTYTWYFRRLSSTEVNFWNQGNQQNLGSFNFSPANSIKKFKGILSFNGTVVNTYVNGIKIGNNIAPISASFYQEFLNNSNSNIRFTKVNLVNRLDSSYVIKFLSVYDYPLSDDQSTFLTRF